MIQDVITELRKSIEKAQDALKRDLIRIRTGRATAGMLEQIRVEYYGQVTALPQMATVSVPEPRLLMVKPWDKSQVSAVERALRESDLGFNPQVDGDTIRIPVPPLSEERRREFVKVAKKSGEECKVAIRHARHEAMDMLATLKTDGDISEDDADRGKKQVEDVVQAGGARVDELVTAKEKEILTV